MNNPNFKVVEFHHFRMQAVLPSSFCECKPRKRKLGVKVVDILGNDTIMIMKSMWEEKDSEKD